MQARMADTHGAFVPAEAVGVSFSLRGEAVVVELPNDRYLFALLQGVPSASWLLYPKMRAEEAGKLIERADGSNFRQVQLSRDQYPLLVTFDDINDPTSVKRVDPDYLAAAFGSGYRLNSITLSLTDEPVTEGAAEAVVQWLRPLGQRQANLLGKPKAGRVSDQPDPRIYLIAPSDFSTELYK
jgi:hypothetical protein